MKRAQAEPRNMASVRVLLVRKCDMRISWDRVRLWATNLVSVGLVMSMGLCLLIPRAVRAQISSASARINGTVSDTSGAAVPGATVVLINMDTQVAQTVTTNDAGDYVIPNIPIGTYTLTISKEGFETLTQEKFKLDVNQATTFNFTLRVGSTKQTVTVEAGASRLQTATAELGTVVTEKMVDSLPMNGRNFTQLLQLTPGVSPVSVAQNSGGWFANPLGPGFMFPAVNGQSNRSNFFMMDGINNLSGFMSEYAVAPQIEDIAEMKAQSHNDDAQFGGALGAIVNLVTKSGTNSFHGSAFDYLQNNVLNARGFFYAPTQKVAPFRQNQFGGSLGGPVIIPHLYNGRDRTFFFASYEGFRWHGASTSTYRVPTPAELGGDLSDFRDSNGKLIPIYDPYSIRPDPAHPGYMIEDQFPNNQIPQDRINPALVLYMASLMPAPVETGIPGINGLDTNPATTRQDLANLRLDERVSDHDSVFVRYTGFSQPNHSDNIATNAFNEYFHGYNAAASWTHTFSGNAVAQFTFGRNIVQDNGITQFTTHANGDYLVQAGFADSFLRHFSTGVTMIPDMEVSGFPDVNLSFGNTLVSDVNEYKGDFSLVHGHHNLRMGADFASTRFEANYNSASIGFDPSATSCQLCFGGQVGGIGLASYLLNVPSSVGRQNDHPVEHSGWVDGFYFQDNWKVNSKLNVNLGLRYDVTFLPVFAEIVDGAGNFDYNTGQYWIQEQLPACSATVLAPCIPGGTLPPGVIVTPLKNHGLYYNTYDNLGPRIGFAYQWKPSLVIRGAYGRFYDNWAAVTQTGQNVRGGWPQVTYLSGSSFNQNSVPTISALDPLAGVSVFTPRATPLDSHLGGDFRDPHFQNPLSDQWNIGFQQQLRANTVLTMNYVGARDTRLDQGGIYNVASSPGPGDPRLLAKFPNLPVVWFEGSGGYGNYHAFQFSLAKRSASGFSYQLSYTWSKTLNTFDGWYGEAGFPRYTFHPEWEYGPSGTDLPHVLTFSWVYPVPIGKGQRWSTNNRALDYALGNWQFNGIFAASSGVPFFASAPGDIANVGYGHDHADRLQGVSAYQANKDPMLWLNPAAFATPAPFTFGTEGRNDLRADWGRNFDISLFREFPLPLGESKRLEFRSEFFNAFNTPLFGNPDSTVGDQFFGRVFSQANRSRRIQFALKLYF